MPRPTDGRNEGEHRSPMRTGAQIGLMTIAAAGLAVLAFAAATIVLV